MVMVAGHESGKMQAPRRKKAPQIMGAAFKQISMITYGLYRGDCALRMEDLGGTSRADNSTGITPTRATEILEECKPRLTDDELEVEYKKWIKSEGKLSSPTLVFQVWMQCGDHVNIATRFGRNSPIYRSLIGCFRGAIFHTLMEKIILCEPISPHQPQQDIQVRVSASFLNQI